MRNNVLPPPQYDWEELPHLLLAREPSAEDAYFRMAWGMLAGAAQGQFGVPGPEVEDFVLEVIEKTLARLNQFQGFRGRFRTWIFVLARRHAIDLWRKRGRSPLDMACEFDVERGLGRYPAAGTAEPLYCDMGLLVARLPPRDQQLVELAFGTSLTSTEIGVELGLNAAAVRQKVRRIVVRLRNLLPQSSTPARSKTPKKLSHRRSS